MRNKTKIATSYSKAIPTGNPAKTNFLNLASVSKREYSIENCYKTLLEMERIESLRVQARESKLRSDITSELLKELARIGI